MLIQLFRHRNNPLRTDQHAQAASLTMFRQKTNLRHLFAIPEFFGCYSDNHSAQNLHRQLKIKIPLPPCLSLPASDLFS